MKNRKTELTIRLSLLFTTIVIIFFSIRFTKDVVSDFSIYLNRDNYEFGNMIVTKIGTHCYGSSDLFASGYVDDVKTSVDLGLAKEVKISDYYPILYKQDGKQSLLITKDFKFNLSEYLYYGFYKMLSVSFLLFLMFRIFRYFKTRNLNFSELTSKV